MVAVGYTVFPPGPLGGFMKCAANGKGDDLTVACAWADGTTLGSVVDVKATEATIDLPALAERARHPCGHDHPGRLLMPKIEFHGCGAGSRRCLLMP
ncbi:hypothetical protein [Kitasatospora sp. NPDC050463]|uniref:hypothetical protein n=1 Tax=Kitasatospora sp. NPDC050463 TaxID=3155786 RepID=UPI0033CAD0BB